MRRVYGDEIATAKGWLAALSYKPDVSIVLDEEGYYTTGNLTLVLTMRVLDVVHRRDEVQVSTRVPLSPAATTSRAAFEHAVFYAIEQVEGHEMKEWFQRDGVPVFDPHPELTVDSRRNV